MGEKINARPTTLTRDALLDEGSDIRFRDMLHGLLALTARLEAIRANLGRALNLTGSQFTILMSIYHLAEQSDVYVSDVAEHLHLSGAFVTNETRKLAAAEVLRKIRDTDDARRVKLEITAPTRRKLTDLAEVQRQINDRMFAEFSRADFIGLDKGISLLVDSCDGAARLSEYLTDSDIGQRA